MAKKTHYAIKKGRESNVIVRTWEQCEGLVHEYPGAIYKGFSCESDAKNFLKSKNPSWIKKPVKKDKFGFKKERYYTANGIRHADYGTTYTENNIDTTDNSVPW